MRRISKFKILRKYFGWKCALRRVKTRSVPSRILSYDRVLCVLALNKQIPILEAKSTPEEGFLLAENGDGVPRIEAN